MSFRLMHELNVSKENSANYFETNEDYIEFSQELAQIEKENKVMIKKL